MSTWASPRDSQDGPKDGAFDVVPVMRNSWAENRENSVRSVRRPQSLLRELDLRFHPDQERKYKQGLQENLVVGGLACIGSATGATLFAVVPTFVREVAREEKAFGTTFDARAWVFLVWALNLLLMLSYILLSTIRLCRGRLQSWNWEAFFVVVVSIVLFSMAFANFWHLPFIVGEDPVGLWVHDARGSDIFMLLAIDGILTMVAMYVPVRSSVLWIPFVCAVVPFFVNTLVFQSVFTDTHMILFALLGLSGFAYHGALRREKTHRQKWTFEHMVEEAEEVMREQDNKIQETTAQVKGLRVVAEALCDVIVKLDSKKCVDGANPRQDAFFETKLEGRCFEDFLSEQDRSRFSKLMSSIQVGFPACMPVTIRKKHLTSEVHLLAVDTGITREPRYLIGMRIEAEHFTAVEEAVVAPQPAQTPAASSGALQGLSSSDSGTLPKESPKETPTEKGSDDTAECTGTTGTTLPGHGTAVVAPQPAQTPAASSGALQGLSSSDSGTLPKESPKETPTEKGSDDTAECTGTTLPGHGTVLELPSEAVERLSPYLCDYLMRAVTSNQKSSWRRALWRLLGRRWLLSAVHSAMKDPLPLVLALDLDPWEVKLDGYSFNLKMPSMRFAVVLQVEVSSIGCSFVRAFAAFPDELVVNLVRCLQEQMQGWDLREMDPRFAGFTQPARVGFDLEVDWPSSSEIRLTAKKLNSRLDLSAS